MESPRGIDCKGKHNYIHGTVTIQQRDPKNPGTCEMGDCNEIHENVKILVGPEGFKMGDYNVLHNGMFITGNVEIGHNCWFGQGTHLDGTAGVVIGNGVTLGYHTHIWSHAARGAELDGCTLNVRRQTEISDNVWLVGNNTHVAPGVWLRYGTIVLSNAVVTKDTQMQCTYAGIPAKQIRKKYWRPLMDQEKFIALYDALAAFVPRLEKARLVENNKTLEVRWGQEVLLFGTECPKYELSKNMTFFDIGKMTYTKRLTYLEIAAIRYLSKESVARFVPVC